MILLFSGHRLYGKILDIFSNHDLLSTFVETFRSEPHWYIYRVV